jgi:hypothetical protein
MAPKTLTLKAPNGKEWEQPTGLFINNEFVESANPENTISSIDPATEKEIAAVQAATRCEGREEGPQEPRMEAVEPYRPWAVDDQASGLDGAEP